MRRASVSEKQTCDVFGHQDLWLVCYRSVTSPIQILHPICQVVAEHSTYVILFCPLNTRTLSQPEGAGCIAAEADLSKCSGLWYIYHHKLAAALTLVALTVGTKPMEQPQIWMLPGPWQRQTRETGAMSSL